ncbi:MAG: YybH family protein [Aquaticitalea sp.]
MSLEKNEIEKIKELKNELAQAIRDKNVKKAYNVFSDDCVMFLLAPPLKCGKDVNSLGVNDFKKWFATWKNAIGLETKELLITHENNIAFLHSLEHLTGTRTDGTESDTWYRETLGLKKISGKWKITHRHQSVPFYMDSGMASTDLKP